MFKDGETSTEILTCTRMEKKQYSNFLSVFVAYFGGHEYEN